MSERDAFSVDAKRGQALQADIPHLYINGFANGLSNADVMLVLEHNSRPVATANAKALEALIKAVNPRDRLVSRWWIQQGY